MARDVLISVKNVSQEFTVGDQVIRPLREVSFDIDVDSFNIIYGPSGSGKTTLLNILTGLLAPSVGMVQVQGKDMFSVKGDELAKFRAERLGFVYQTNFWVKSLDVLDNVAISLYFAGKNRKDGRKEAMKALELVHMESYAKKFPILLSGGEQQRIAMARALATNPSFIVADEPTGSLDSKSGDMIINLLRDLQKTLRRTVILVTHNMEYIPYADQLIHIKDGQVETFTGKTIQSTAAELLRESRERINHIYSINGINGKDHHED